MGYYSIVVPSSHTELEGKMGEPKEDDDEFPPDLPKFNRYSFVMVNRCKKKLLPVQLEALESLQRWFQNKESQIALVWMPTGSGKTGIITGGPSAR